MFILRTNLPGITKKHILHLHSSDFLRVIVDPDSQPSGFQVAARSMRDWLDHFSIAFSSATSIANSGGVRGDSQLAWMFTDEEVRVKNFDTGGSYGGAAALSTEIKLSVKEFDMYEVFDGRQDLALPMREFKVRSISMLELTATGGSSTRRAAWDGSRLHVQ